MAAERLKIVILGGSFAGISCVHHLVKNAIPEITANKKFAYKIVVVTPSTHIYWNISAPRALVSDQLIAHQDSFQPLANAFKDYDPEDFEYVDGTAVGLDTKNREITIAPPAHDADTSTHGVEPSVATKIGRAVSTTTRAAKHISGFGNLPDEPPPTTWGAFQSPSDETYTIDYHALIIATGSTAHTPLMSLRGPHLNTLYALDEFHKRLPTADTVVIAGGGPSGVETAGQIAYWFNLPFGPRKPVTSMNPLSWFTTTKTGFRPYSKKIILLSGALRLLPQLEESVGLKAYKQLSGLGVKVVHDTRVVGATVSKENKTTLKLSNGDYIQCDLYIPCTGVSPNTQFLPSDSPLIRNGYIATTPMPSTLRVEVPPELAPTDDSLPPNGSNPPPPRRLSEGDVNQNVRVYGIGDCAAYSSNCIMDVYAAIPVLMNNMVNDLLAYQKFIENPYGGNRDEIEELSRQDYEYTKDPRDSQIVPIGYRKPGGVGVVYGHKLPSFVVWLAKGRKYKIEAAKTVIEKGLSPY
ncbi:MAG: hypothetical protein Q9159_000200 [Coniocarpon cinnabarinum]